MADGKWIEGLSPGMPLSEAARIALTIRFGVVREALPPAVERAGEDIEFVHQLRVSTRRAGAALKLLGDSLPKKLRERAKKTLRTLRRAAGDARDWDVFLLGLASARSLKSAAGKPALDFLLGYALNERAAAQECLSNAAASVGLEFNELCDELPAAIGEGEQSQTFADRADEQVRALFVEFNEAVAADPTHPDELHQLRIRGKRVRYAMELFVGCFTPPFRDQLYPAIEELQEILGNLQDANVGTERLENLRTRVQAMMPAEWPRLRPGIGGLFAALKRKIPASRKQFKAWQANWAKRKEEHPIEALQPLTI